MKRLAVRVLGTFAVEGLDEREIGSRKARALLKLLACERGAPVSVDRIIDALWAEHGPARPADQVSVLVSRLRSVLDGRILRTDAGYSLRYDWLDLDELIARSREAVVRLHSGRPGAAFAAASAALRLVGERVLADEDAAWADDTRAQIDRVIAAARHAGAEAALAIGASSDAVVLGTDALDQDPYDEAALQIVMRALAHLGRPGSALALYAAFKEQLVDAFGVGPTADTESVHDEIVLGGYAAAPVSRDGGGQVSGLIGRRAELDALDARLEATHSGSCFILIEGEPGMGKTALVQAWALRAERSGAHVLIGRCDQLGVGLPLQPVLDALNDWLVRFRGAGAVDELVRDDPVLAALLGITAEVGGRTGADEITTAEEPDTGRRRLFAALASLIERVRDGSPVALIVDDIDHADPSTLAWLSYVARSSAGVLVVATSRSRVPVANVTSVLALGPLDRTAATQLLGDDDIGFLYHRSGGNPLFLTELAQVADGEMPGSIVEAVRRRVSALGAAASTLRIAALLGEEIDLDLLAACCRRPIAEVLDHIEVAVRSDLLNDDARGLRFRHDIVREALEAATTGSVRAFVHREASMLLAARPDRRPLDTAHHAERGGAAEIASDAFVEGAGIAADRFETDLAGELLNRAIDLVDSPRARMARARVHLTQRALDRATVDIDAALAVERTTSALELAGWIAYYRRDYPTALRYAEEARLATISTEVQQSAAMLEGRIRHSQGDLHGAFVCLEPAAGGPESSNVRGVARVWLSAVCTHQGRVDAALASLDAGGDPASLRSHPFATGHAWFVRCLATGISGALPDAFRAVEGLERHANGSGVGGMRFRPFACNMRGWLERSVGNLDVAADCSMQALESAGHAAFDEPAMHARLDLVENFLVRGRNAEASTALREAVGHLVSNSTMAWHQHQRVAWLSGRLALLDGDYHGAAGHAEALANDAAARGSPRYGVLARHLGLLAASQSPSTLTNAAIADVLAGVDRLAALDAWRLVAELAAVTDLQSLWAEAHNRAAALAAQTRSIEHLDPNAVGRWMHSTIDDLRPRR